jgi:methionyl-tRNA formyltransferase
VIPDAPWRVVVVSLLPFVAKAYVDFCRKAGHEPVAHIAFRSQERLAESPESRDFALQLLTEGPPDVDLVYPATRASLAPILRGYGADLLLCTAFPWRLPADALAVPRLGCVNGHPSLLPRHRGPIPIAWAMRGGETEIGLTYHFMDADFDTGNILAQQAVPLDAEDTFEALVPKLQEASAALLPVVFERLARGEGGEAQVGGDYQSVFEEEYAYADTSRTAREVHTQARAWPLAGGAPGLRGPILERDGESRRLLRTSLTEVEGAERLDCADGPLWIVESEPVESPTG